jgi:hypothetical protein
LDNFFPSSFGAVVGFGMDQIQDQEFAILLIAYNFMKESGVNIINTR